MTNKYHYTECGLDNVWLCNGFTLDEDQYGEWVSIDNVDGLHKAIGMAIVSKQGPLNGQEIRFLRIEMDFSQGFLADLVGVSESTYRNWEHDRPAITGPGDRIIRHLYLEYSNEIGSLRKQCEELSQLNHEIHSIELELEETDQGWSIAA